VIIRTSAAIFTRYSDFMSLDMTTNKFEDSGLDDADSVLGSASPTMDQIYATSRAVSHRAQPNSIEPNERLIFQLPAITGKVSKSYRLYMRESSRWHHAHLVSAGKTSALAVGVKLIVQSSARTRSTTTRNSPS
jgi:hypothetical protein